MKRVFEVSIISIISMFIFYISNIIFLSIVGKFIFVGDLVTISYHMFTYTGLMILCAVVISCTYIVIKKVNDLLNYMDNMYKK